MPDLYRKAKFEKGTVPAGAVPFQLGQSGNPAGRPVGSRDRANVLRRWLDTPATVTPTERADPELGTLEDALAVALLRRALTGDPRAYREVMDSVYGKVPTAPVDVPAPVGTVTIRIIEHGPPLASKEDEVVM